MASMDYQQNANVGHANESDENGPKKQDKSVFDERTEEASASQYFQFYGYLAQQQNMMQDYVRTSTYQKAVLANLSDFKDKVVLDVGAGSGILSFFAAQAGAKHVYAVEASSMALHCETLVKANGFDKRITVLAGKIEDINLPERVDTIISEPMGYMLLNERMLESFLHAKKFLKPGGKMYPSRGDLYIAPFCDEALYMEQCTKANFWCQESFHGVNLLSLREQALKEYFRQPVVDTFHVGILLAPSIQWTLDFSRWHEEDLHRIEIPLEYVISQTGYVHGLAFWFDVAFIGTNQTVWLSTAPTEPLTHWYQVRCLLEKPILCQHGGVLRGHVHLTANKRQSYDVEIVLQCEGIVPSADGGPPSVQVARNTLDLKNPCFRYTGQPVQPPPGSHQQAGTGNGISTGNNTGAAVLQSPTDAYWQSVLAAATLQQNALVENGGNVLMNGNIGIPLPTTANPGPSSTNNHGPVSIDNLTANVDDVQLVTGASGIAVPTIGNVVSLFPTGHAIPLSPTTVLPPNFVQGSYGNPAQQQPASPHHSQIGAMPAACLPVTSAAQQNFSLLGNHAGVANEYYAVPGVTPVALANQQPFPYQTIPKSPTTAGNQPACPGSPAHNQFLPFDSCRSSNMERKDLSHTYIGDEAKDHFYYFAFGSNMCTERLHILNPSAIYVCNGVLLGYRMGFGGPVGRNWHGAGATIFEDKHDVVCGVVYKLGKEHSETLDMQERGYRRLTVDVKILPSNDQNALFTNGHTALFSTIRCRTYQMMLDDEDQTENKPPCLPSPQYRHVILCGSKEHRLPLEYHKRLEKMQHNGYSGPVAVPLSIFQDGRILPETVD